MKAKSYEMVIPKPYLSVHFDCGYRKFYNVMNEVDAMLREMWEEAHPDEDFNTCDHYHVLRDSDCDPEEIRIDNRDEEEMEWVNKILAHYEVEPIEVGINVVLSPY